MGSDETPAEFLSESWLPSKAADDIGVTLGLHTQLVTEQHRAAGHRLDEVFSP